MKIIVLIVLLLSLLSSCSKSNDDSSIPGKEDEQNNIKKEVVIQSAGSISRSSILAEEHPNSLHPMQVFETKRIMEDGLFSEIKTKVSPYSLIFNFYPMPYIEEVSEPKGFLSFTKIFANAMKSEEWKVFNESDITSKSLTFRFGTPL